MKKEHDNLDTLFDKLQNQWDFEELESGHEMRFLQKQKSKPKKKFWIPMSVAASILIIVGFFTFFNPPQAKAKNLDFASAQTREADSVFTAVINVELQKLKSDDSPQNKKIIEDALQQMNTMDADYEKIKQELIKNGENKQIIYAMISNLQIRISFLENVMKQIEKNNKIKYPSDEKII